MNVQTLLRPAVAGPGRVILREPNREEASEIGALLHSAFTLFQTSHGFGSDFETAEGTIQFATAMIDDPMCYAVVAVKERRIVGVNFLGEGDPIRGVGPIAVAPDADDSGVGRSLMHDVIERAGDAPGVRLLQDTFNLKSLALYTTLGFRTRDPYVVVKGRLKDAPRLERVVRPMEPRDLPAVAALSNDLTGFPRRGDVQRALSEGSPYVVLNE
ncbi:MAG: GNAT family N-acetyltransferase, partial [Silicimonas sp.]|nr:GNAT family N-acetyltransferase [Silicimonas sp.]